MKKTLFALSFLFSTFLISSCTDEIDFKNLNTNMELASDGISAPLGKADMNIGELLKNFKPENDISFGENEEGVVSLFYNQKYKYDAPNEYQLDTFGVIREKISLNPTEELGLSNISTDLPGFGNTPLTLPVGFTKTYDLPTRYFNLNEMNDDLDKQRIDSIRFWNATVSIELETSFDVKTPNAILLHFTMDENDFIGLDKEEIVKATGFTDNPRKLTREVPLQYFVVKGSENGVYKTKTPLNMHLTLTGDGQTKISDKDYINLRVKFNYNESNFLAYGWFKHTESVNDEISFDFYNFLPEGSFIEPLSPKIEANINSGVGFPVTLNIKKLTAYSEKGESATVGNEVLGERTTNPAKETHDNSNLNVERATTTIVYKEGIENLFKIPLNKVSVDLDVSGGKDGSSGFICNKSDIDIDFNIEIPLHLSGASKIIYTDTITDINISDFVNEEYVKSASIIVNCDSHLPFGAELELTLLDENNLPIIDTRIHKYTIEPALVDKNGKDISNKQSSFVIKYNDNLIAGLAKCRNIEIKFRSSINSINGMKLYSTDGLKINIGLKIDEKIEIKF
jgi:hypothetical protein